MERNKKIKYISYLKEWKIEDEIKMTKPTETEEDDGRKIFTDGSVRQDGENLESENIIADKYCGQTENDLLSDKIKNEAGNVIRIEKCPQLYGGYPIIKQKVSSRASICMEILK